MLEDPNKKVVLLATGAAVASVLTRVSVGLGAVSAVVIVGLFLWNKKRPLSLVMIGGALSGVAIHCALNFAKMGSLFDLPGDRQVLTLTNPERAIWFAGNNNSFLEFLLSLRRVFIIFAQTPLSLSVFSRLLSLGHEPMFLVLTLWKAIRRLLL